MRALTLALGLLLAGCGGVAATPMPTSEPAVSPEAAICEVFDEPADDIREVFAVIEQDTGDVVSPLISAKERLLAIAEQLDGTERDDVMALHDGLFVGSADTTQAAVDAWAAFQAKYADHCP